MHRGSAYPNDPASRTYDNGTMSDRTMSDETMSIAGASPDERLSIWETGKLPSQKCSARKGDTGEPCKAWAIQGGNVCVYHGGKAPQVREAARRRLEALVPLALDALTDLIEGKAHDPGSDAPMAVPPGVRARACAEILRSSGVGAPNALDVSVTNEPNPDLDDAIAAALAARGHGPRAAVARR